ncbi:MAG: competence protein ComEC, partial [Rhodobacteraceae bacterium]
VLLGCGIGFYFALPVEPPLMVSAGVAGVFALLAGVLRHRHQAGRAILAAGVCALALGVALAGLRTWVVAAPVLSGEIGPVTVIGQVAEVEPLVKGLRVMLENIEVQRLGPAATPKQLRLTLMGAQPVFEAGDWLQLRAKLTPPPGPAAPGAFDFQRQSYFEGLGGVGFTLGKAEVVGKAPESGVASLGFAFQRFRARLAERVRAQIPGQPGELAVAFTTGTRGAISEEVLEAMRISGLAHLIAISGLNVGLAAGIVFFTVRALLALVPAVALRQPIKKYAALCAIAGALFYALIAGATVPPLRAFLMVALVFMAVLADRQALSMRAVAWAALVILVISPEALLGASFQMSFAAVVALIAVYETLRRQPWFFPRDLSFAQRAGRYVLGVALTTLVAGLATTAFGAFHFNRVADYSLAANLIAVPLTTLWIMPWAVLAFALMPIGLESFA